MELIPPKPAPKIRKCYQTSGIFGFCVPKAYTHRETSGFAEELVEEKGFACPNWMPWLEARWKKDFSWDGKAPQLFAALFSPDWLVPEEMGEKDLWFPEPLPCLLVGRLGVKSQTWGHAVGTQAAWSKIPGSPRVAQNGRGYKTWPCLHSHCLWLMPTTSQCSGDLRHT